MRILLWHGYLLSGSGSNIYTANVASAWRAQGHDVVVMCQDRDPRRFDFVDDDGTVDAGTLSKLAEATRRGRCIVVRPDIGEILPVYVYDEYESFVVKRFVDLDDEDLDNYTRKNVDAMSAALDAFDPEAIVTGHEVMGPEIARLACEPRGRPFVAKLHGSALEYAVKEQDRYLGFAESGLNAAHRVVGGSRYMLEAAAAAIPGEWTSNARVVNPGCDIEIFKPVDRVEPERPVVAFVGKLIEAKGVHNLLAAIGLTHERGFEVVVVGYGGFEDELEQLSDALASGDRARARALLDGSEDPKRVADLAGFLEDVPDDGYWRRQAEIPVTFTGRLEHGPLSRRLPDWDVLVVPSIVPEAFGMVAAEAAACGVLPIVPRHSGIGEVGDRLETHLGMPGLLTFDPSDPIRGIAGAIDRVLALSFERRRELGLEASRLAREAWSWDVVAESLLAAATE